MAPENRIEKEQKKSRKITWLGQAGLLFEIDGKKIIVDPYLSDSCHKVNPKSIRRYPVEESFLDIVPDVLILTHDHLDHTDPESLVHYLQDIPVTVLASQNAWNMVRKMGGAHNYVMFNSGTEFTVCGITFRAVYAEHSDEHAIGVMIKTDEMIYYVTGDTLYNQKVLDSIKEQIDVVFLPINGRGNNMNAVDAARFVKKIGAKMAVPLHFGLFDEMDGSELEVEEKVIPKPFSEIVI